MRNRFIFSMKVKIILASILYTCIFTTTSFAMSQEYFNIQSSNLEPYGQNKDHSIVLPSTEILNNLKEEMDEILVADPLSTTEDDGIELGGLVRAVPLHSGVYFLIIISLIYGLTLFFRQKVTKN